MKLYEARLGLLDKLLLEQNYFRIKLRPFVSVWVKFEFLETIEDDLLVEEVKERLMKVILVVFDDF